VAKPSPGVAAVSPSSAAATAVSPIAALSDIQQQMVQQFSAQSGMNVTWSARYNTKVLVVHG